METNKDTPARVVVLEEPERTPYTVEVIVEEVDQEPSAVEVEVIR